MADHAWCRDPSRDERVRAAEDGRTAPLPTLEECIETAFSAGVRDSFRKVEEAWSMIPKSVSASSPVDQENKGNGMRTERVTLEVTHDASRDDPRLIDAVRRIAYAAVEREFRYPGESVRVVEEAHFDDLAQVAMERDAAIHERDAAVAESERRLRLCETMKRDGDSARFHAAVAQARVAELEAASGGGEQPRGWLTASDRQNLEEIAVCLDDDNWQHSAAFVRSLLARSTPPQVRLPEPVGETKSHGPLLRKRDVLAALAAAGVAVKEVGRE